MGQPVDDVDRLRQVLELLRERGLLAARLRVGSVELDGLVLLSPPGHEGAETGGLTDLTPEELEALRDKETESNVYGASA